MRNLGVAILCVGLGGCGTSHMVLWDEDGGDGTDTAGDRDDSVSPRCVCNGDVDGDGGSISDVGDIAAVGLCLDSDASGSCAAADVNCDGIVDAVDREAVLCAFADGDDCCAAPSDEDGDGYVANVDCDDSDDTVASFAERECTSECATGVETCFSGIWRSCDAPSGAECECEPGEVRMTEALRCGMQLQVCSHAAVWEDEGAPQDEGECSPGMLEEVGPCGNCGTLRRICLDTCQWDEARCEGRGECEAGDVDTNPRNCGGCGSEQEQTRTCDSTCSWGVWGDWGACEGVAGCVPASTENEEQSCGSCGTQSRSRSCSAACSWGAYGTWSSCSGGGECAPSTLELSTETCASDEVRGRICTSSCGWGDWSSCS